MEKKYRISEFAALLGITPKTVYRMIEREEVKTIQEKVNNRLIAVVVTNDAEIENLKTTYSKYTGLTGNCEDILTDNNDNITSNNNTQSNNNNISASELFEKIVTLNEEYNNRIQTLNEELIDSKSKLLLLEDKAGREGLYLNEITTLKNDNRELMKSKQTLFNTSMIVITILLLVIISLCKFNVGSNNSQEQVIEKNTAIEQKVEVVQPKPVEKPKNKGKK